MSGHLPECIAWHQPPEVDIWGPFAQCICGALRACEQRLMRDGITKARGVWHDGYGEGYAAGLDAAREAVATELGWEDADPSDDYKPHTAIWKFRALAAIDALREETK